MMSNILDHVSVTQITKFMLNNVQHDLKSDFPYDICILVRRGHQHQDTTIICSTHIIRVQVPNPLTSACLIYGIQVLYRRRPYIDLLSPIIQTYARYVKALILINTC